MEKNMRFGFIGCGNMGGAILKGGEGLGLLSPENVCIYDISKEVTDRLRADGYKICTDLRELCSESDIIVLAVKPQYFPDVRKEIEGLTHGKCALSIMAGIYIKDLKEALGEETRIFRTMPNTPALVNRGVFAVCVENDASPEEKELISKLLSSMGKVYEATEEMTDVFCGFSGSGPAYVAMFVEALADGAVLEGMPRALAYKVALETVEGSARLMLEKNMHPGALKDMVSSPKGTTIEGVKALEKGAFRHSVMESVIASVEKTKKLGK
jgi:pyrroline-5-carboxylate reductase